jgi:hypothetical protein
MIKKMKLWGDIINTPSGFIFESSHCDGSSFSLPVFPDDVQIASEFVKDVAQGWLYVIQEGQQDVRCYITLPRPSLQFGKHITVNQSQLDSRATSVSDFKPRVIGKLKTVLTAKEEVLHVEKTQAVVEETVKTVVTAKPEVLAPSKTDHISVKQEPIVENVKNVVFNKGQNYGDRPLVNGKKKEPPQKQS